MCGILHKCPGRSNRPPPSELPMQPGVGQRAEDGIIMLERLRSAFHRSSWRRFYGFLRFVVVRYLNDRCFETAGALSYTSLLAIVPLFAVFLSILSAFPFFARLRDRAEAELSEALLPHAE